MSRVRLGAVLLAITRLCAAQQSYNQTCREGKTLPTLHDRSYRGPGVRDAGAFFWPNVFIASNTAIGPRAFPAPDAAHICSTSSAAGFISATARVGRRDGAWGVGASGIAGRST